MSEENVQHARNMFANWGEDEQSRRTFFEEAARAGRIAPDAELDFSAMYPDAPIQRGVEAWIRYFRSMPWGDSVKLQPEQFFDVDDERVLVFVHVTAEGAGSGIPVEIRNAYEFTIRDGVLIRWRVFADRAAALEAAGLAG